QRQILPVLLPARARSTGATRGGCAAPGAAKTATSRAPRSTPASHVARRAGHGQGPASHPPTNGKPPRDATPRRRHLLTRRRIMLLSCFRLRLGRLGWGPEQD